MSTGQDSERGDELDRRIDQALQRHFALPVQIDTLAARALRARSSSRRFVAPLAFCAAAAAVVLLGLWMGEHGGRRRDPLTKLADDAPARAPTVAPTDPFLCRLVGPLDRVDAEPRGVQSPDLALLYRDMDACQRSAAALACDDEEGLAERLQATYGQPLLLRPEAAGLLNGPFLSDAWTTGTILTGSSEDQTAVLVAERHSTLACCVQMRMPKDSGLRMFSWQYGDLVLTEITPFDEPRLLACFE